MLRAVFPISSGDDHGFLIRSQHRECHSLISTLIEFDFNVQPENEAARSGNKCFGRLYRPTLKKSYDRWWTC